MDTQENQDGPDPVEVLRAMLAIKPDSAKEVREIADTKAMPDSKNS